jgi:hypothetical protein
VRFSFSPLTGTSAGFPRRNHPALSGGGKALALPPFANVHGSVSPIFSGVFGENRERSPSYEAREKWRKKASMENDIPQLRTPGVIAAELDAPLSRVLYVLRTRSLIIRPIGRAGVLRLYDRSAVEMVRNALSEMDQRQALARREAAYA